jgi:pimeloyl-ACP methyl ester carboxylesterase
LTKFDWRAAETEINRFPQLMAKVDSQPIHFFHVPGKSPNAKPVMLVHGWPYSNLSFVPFLERLTDPAKYGGKAEDALTIIAPAIPGHAFSKADKPFGPKRTAALLHMLATEVLGYSRYGFQGGDHGCLVGAYIAAAHPESLFGLHLNLVPVNLPPPAEQNAEDKAWDAAGAAFMQAEFDYFRAQMGKPMMVGSVLAASPFSTAAWIAEKFWAWTDHGGDLDKVVSKDRLLTEIMAYVATDSIESSMWFYRQLRDEIGFRLHPGGRIAVPTGVYLPEKEFVLGNPPRAIIERNYNLVHEMRPKTGRHFPFYERPEVFAADIRQFFASLNL